MSARSVRAKFFLTGFFRCRGDDLWPLKCGKGRATFSVFELDNGGAWLLPFQRAQRALRLAGPPCGCVSNHSEHPERLPSRRVVEAAGGGEKKTGVSPGCQTRDVFRLGPGWHVHTNKDAAAGVLATWWCQRPVWHPTTAEACRENR